VCKVHKCLENNKLGGHLRDFHWMKTLSEAKLSQGETLGLTYGIPML